MSKVNTSTYWRLEELLLLIASLFSPQGFLLALLLTLHLLWQGRGEGRCDEWGRAILCSSTNNIKNGFTYCRCRPQTLLWP